jgi:hypothetical protein
VSTKVPTRKRFHENLFVASELKALSSSFCALARGQRAQLRRARAQSAAATLQNRQSTRREICARPAAEK